ncbi:putative multi-domain containing protein [Aduncisulcus paluster]|uniref:tRNA (guanine-N(7)-)-methyltransferase n=1 Tax=Aduncisulcus paluster TaxID=2918883 RepID=A0ABQ5KQW1_9EUKA|nr:putative multi-domain containing protein [Aduncisulcus paluster]|eukprot:gnl/Carplike_NY0171/4892_a6665_257.p1 GENE.gnl/Carplike_NY0171/4892_a6665_257~~gnl/Carplike_NY0171/4892_a6665_257.p1  ORF type:complete len:294 (+),score=38.04 gnl/Carplike_NY0171/4892_a6665_257:5-886(+)
MEGFAKKADGSVRVVKKFRSRAHANPLSDDHIKNPSSPDDFDYAAFYPGFSPEKRIAYFDIGSGYGGLLSFMAPHLPDDLIIGMELRVQPVSYAQEQILRQRNPSRGSLLEGEKMDEESGKRRFLEKDTPAVDLSPIPVEKHHFNNVACVRCNVMKAFHRYSHKGQAKGLFILFPDPHWKKANIRRRIVSQTLLDVYAYSLKIGGHLFIATDVEDLFHWMCDHVDTHPLFERMSEADQEKELTSAEQFVFKNITEVTADATRAQRKKPTEKRHKIVYRRIIAKKETEFSRFFE